MINKYHNQGRVGIVKNAVFLSLGNTTTHELFKFTGSVMVHKHGDVNFTELVRDKIKQLAESIDYAMKDFETDVSDFGTEVIPNDNPKRRIDLVKYSDDYKFEFETDHNIKKAGTITIKI